MLSDFNWLIFALLGHTANGAAFIIDKILLTKAFKRSATYAGLVGLLSFVVIVALPWVKTWPNGNIIALAGVSGVTFVLALWAFFAALARAEASRVVPIVGSLIPLLTLIGTYIFLGERLTSAQLLGFAFLILATALLSGSGGSARPSTATLGFALASAGLFAVSSVSAKVVYDAAGFLSGFINTRLAATLTALIIVSVVDRPAGSELRSMLKKSDKGPGKKAAALAIFGQSLGAVGFLFVQLGIAKGSAAIVNALQAIQYAFLVLVALAFRHLAPQLLGERLESKAVAIKLLAIGMTAIGLMLVV